MELIVKVEIDLSDRVLDLLKALGGMPEGETQAKPKPAKVKKIETVDDDFLDETTDENEAEPELTDTYIRKMATEKGKESTGMRDKVKKLINTYGENLAAIPEKKYPEFLKKLNALK